MDMTVSQLKRNITAGLTPVVGQGEASAMCREIIRFLLGYSPAKAVIVGDRMDTDVIAGLESGADTVLVLSGVSDRDTPKTFAYQPTMILNGVGDIPVEAEK